MADTGTELEVRDPDILVTEMERTRDELARTIDAIADRVSPANNARRVMERVREQASNVDPRFVVAGAVAVAGIAALLLWRRRR